VVKSHLIKRAFKKNYKIWTTHGEIDDALLKVNTGGLGHFATSQLHFLVLWLEVSHV
jgi:hypothetical protein